MTRQLQVALALAAVAMTLAACTGTSEQPAAPATSPGTHAAVPTQTPAASPSSPATRSAAPEAGSTGQTAGKLEVFTHLRAGPGYPRAAGSSEYDQEHGTRELHVTLTGISGLAGHSVTVLVGGRRIGTVAVLGSGRAHGKWDTEHGQHVPGVVAGNQVQIRTAGGAVVASGIYAPKHED